MERHLQETAEGVHTVRCDQTGQSFHSRFGSLQESTHVYIMNGLAEIIRNIKRPSILETGFGTGLNAILTQKYLVNEGLYADYTAIELFPLQMDLISKLNYFNYIDRSYRSQFFEMHTCEWNMWNDIGNLRFKKLQFDISKGVPEGNYDLVFYDAFSPSVQPELWSRGLFELVYERMNQHGILVTYCSKGAVQRCMSEAGFSVEKPKGPAGKREIIRAYKEKLN